MKHTRYSIKLPYHWALLSFGCRQRKSRGSEMSPRANSGTRVNGAVTLTKDIWKDDRHISFAAQINQIRGKLANRRKLVFQGTPVLNLPRLLFLHRHDVATDSIMMHPRRFSDPSIGPLIARPAYAAAHLIGCGLCGRGENCRRVFQPLAGPRFR